MDTRLFAGIRSLLFDNMSVRQTVFKNAFWLGVAEVVGKLAKALLLIYVARELGATEFGKFTFALAFVAIPAILSDFGLSRLAIREFSRDKDKERHLSSLLSLRILLSLAAFAVIFAGSFLVTPDPAVRGLIWVLSVHRLIDVFSGMLYAFLRARQQMQFEAVTRVFSQLALVGLGFFVMFNFPSVANLSYAYVFSGAVALALLTLFFHLRVLPLSLSFDKSIWRPYLAMSWPLAFVAFAHTIFNRTDSVMLGAFGQMTETGWYNAAHRITDAALIPSLIIAASFFPVMSIAFSESERRLQRVWNYRMGIAVTLAIPLIAGGLALAPQIIDFVYGPSFAPSVLAFRILMAAAGVVFLVGPFSQALIVSNQQRRNFWIALSAALVNVILNLVLIPHYSLYGAAAATLTTMVLMLVLSCASMLRLTSVSPFNAELLRCVVVAALSVVPMYFVISDCPAGDAGLRLCRVRLEVPHPRFPPVGVAALAWRL